MIARQERTNRTNGKKKETMSRVCLNSKFVELKFVQCNASFRRSFMGAMTSKLNDFEILGAFGAISIYEACAASSI